MFNCLRNCHTILYNSCTQQHTFTWTFLRKFVQTNHPAIYWTTNYCGSGRPFSLRLASKGSNESGKMSVPYKWTLNRRRKDTQCCKRRLQMLSTLGKEKYHSSEFRGIRKYYQPWELWEDFRARLTAGLSLNNEENLAKDFDGWVL